MTHSVISLSAPADRVATARSRMAPANALNGSAFTYSRAVGRLIDGARLVFLPGSDLVIGTAPVEEVDLLLTQPELRTAAYIILSHADGNLHSAVSDAKVGETGEPARRWKEHLRRPPVAGERCFFIGTTKSEGFGKDALLSLQAALTQQATRAGRCRVVGAAPERSWLERVDPGLMIRWLADARALLVGAGCFLLEPRGAGLRPAIAVQAADGPVVGPGQDVVAPAEPIPALLKRGYRLASVPIPAVPPSVRHTLEWRGVRATAIAYANGTVVIEAGSVFAGKSRSGIQQGVANKRARMRAAGLFHVDTDGLLRLTRAIEVPSLTNGARLATASNLPGRALWSPTP